MKLVELNVGDIVTYTEVLPYSRIHIQDIGIVMEKKPELDPFLNAIYIYWIGFDKEDTSQFDSTPYYWDSRPSKNSYRNFIKKLV